MYYNLTSHKNYIIQEKEWILKKRKKTVVRKMNLRGKNSKWAFTIIHTLKYILDQLKSQM